MARARKVAVERRRFEELVEEALAQLPARFRALLENVVIIVEDAPAAQRALSPGDTLLLGLFQGVPRPQKTVFDPLPTPDRIVLYQRNIEAVCRTEEEIREQVRLTVLHELGHYFGLSEAELHHL